MLAFDHVIVTVADLDAAAERIRSTHGLGSLPGGRHPGHGTENRVIPLGPDYIELMGVAHPDEAVDSMLGRWVLANSGEGDRVAALCLRTDDIEGVARRLGREALPMSRRTPDGATLTWRLVGLRDALADGLPFFIEWGSGDHPGRLECNHAVRPTGIRWVEVGGEEARISDWVGDHDLDLRHLPGRRGPVRVGIGATGGDIVLD